MFLVSCILYLHVVILPRVILLVWECFATYTVTHMEIRGYKCFPFFLPSFHFQPSCVFMFNVQNIGRIFKNTNQQFLSVKWLIPSSLYYCDFWAIQTCLAYPHSFCCEVTEIFRWFFKIFFFPTLFWNNIFISIFFLVVTLEMHYAYI